MLRDVFQQLLSGSISRRQFLNRLGQLGVGAMAATQLADVFAAVPESEHNVILNDVTGGRITCETLKLWGVQYVFGNTGAYEAGFIDALVDFEDIHYVLGLQEGSVMAMADGYARITGQTSFVNIHSITGTANALGMIVNAWADSSPVVISVGFSERSGENLGVFTETNKLETIPELFTKLSFRSSRVENLGESLRRAFRLASVLPGGPVFLGVPSDVWAGQCKLTSLIPASRTVSTSRIHPDSSAVEQAAQWLVDADNPLLIAGAELPRWGGLAELATISDQLGATVSGDTSSSRSSMGFPSDHPRYLGAMRGAIQTETPFDVVLIAGASRFSLSRRGHPLIPTEAKIIEIGLREEHLARSYPADLLIYAHAQETLGQLADAIRARNPNQRKKISRGRVAGELKQQKVAQRTEVLERVWDSSPIAPERLASEINQAIASNAVVVTEGVSSDAAIWDYMTFDQPGGGRRHLISSGGSLGWGVGAAIGAKLGAPDNQVIALVGDGSYQFAVQALWTAKRFEVPMIIVIFNNLGYQANRWALAGLGGRAAETGHYIGISLDDPQIDHVGIARAYGHEGERVSRARDLGDALKRAVAAEQSGGVYVLDVLVDRRGGGADADWHEKHVPQFSS
ncbi:MAG: thiamine pyrophosphate-binding protein [Gammaproteobacteria bacterium]|nr:MAG: thiamine pyrophosphate-binding protein [Gammaproteobacteria bacterium]